MSGVNYSNTSIMGFKQIYLKVFKGVLVSAVKN